MAAMSMAIPARMSGDAILVARSDIYALISDNIREVPNNDDDGFYAADLIGYTIVHADGRPVGKITDINDSKPIRIIFVVGLVLLLIDVLVAIYIFSSYFAHSTIDGWTSIMLSVNNRYKRLD